MNPLRKVVKVASESSHRCRHGAIIVKGKKLISQGINRARTHPKSIHPYSAIHAEFDAICKARGGVEGATMYVTRLLADGTKGMSKPCPHCQRVIEESGIAAVVYTDNTGEFITSSV